MTTTEKQIAYSTVLIVTVLFALNGHPFVAAAFFLGCFGALGEKK